MAKLRDFSTITEDVATVGIDEQPPTTLEEQEPELIDADPDAGFHYPYYLYAPWTDDERTRPVLVEPVNSGTVDDDLDVHRQAAESTIERGISRDISEEVRAPFIVPVFPRPREEPVDDRHYVHALDDTTMAIEDGPLERVDLQLLAMVEDASGRLSEDGYPVDEGILLNGFSAAGNFVERFTILHPEEVVAVTAGGLNGMPVLPIEETLRHTLEYPIGVANFDELIDTAFDLAAFRTVPRFYYMGEFDGSDTIPYGDAWTREEMREIALDVYGMHMVDERFPYSKAMHDAVDAGTIFRTYEGAHHSPRVARDDILAFHARAIDGDAIDELRADFGGGVTELGAHIEHTPASPAPDESITFDAGASAIWGQVIDTYEWEFSDGITATGETISHTFATEGAYNVRLSVTDEDGGSHETIEQVVVGDTTPPRERIGTRIEWASAPRAGMDELQVRYSVAKADSEADRLRAFDVEGDQLTESPLAPTPGEERTAILSLERELLEDEAIYVALLPTGGYDLDSAKEDAYDLIEATVEPKEERIPGQEPTLIEADEDAGFNYPYYLYAPDTMPDASKPILVEPVNSGTASDDMDVHLDAAERTIDRGLSRSVADDLRSAFVVPVFPRPRRDPVGRSHYVHALDDTTMAIEDGPLERVDLQLLAMVEDARERLRDEEYPVEEGIMLNGFSASGNFVERFAALQPAAVISVTAGGLNGMPILPTTETWGQDGELHTLDFHVGVADLEDLIGEPFDVDAFANVNRFLYMGEIDMNDTIPYTDDAWTDEELQETALEVYGRNMQAERFPSSRAIFEAADHDAVFRMYRGAHHTPRPARDDLVEFHERSIAGDSIEELQRDLGGNVPNRDAAVRHTPRRTTTGIQVAFHAADTETRNRAPDSFEWAFGDGDTASGLHVTHTYAEPGTYEVTLTVTTDAGVTYSSEEFVEIVDPVRQYAVSKVIDTDGLRDAVEDWRSGDIETDLLRDVVGHWRSGDPVG